MLLCRHDLSLGRPHQKRSSKRRERWQEGSLTQHRAEAPAGGSAMSTSQLRRVFQVPSAGGHHWAGSALSRPAMLRMHRAGWWTFGTINLPEDEKRGMWGLNHMMSEKASPQVPVSKLPDINSLDTQRAGGRNWPTAPRTPSSCLIRGGGPPSTLIRVNLLLFPGSWLYLNRHTQAHQLGSLQPHGCELQVLSSWGLAVPPFGLFALAIPYMTILCAFPQASCITPASLLSSAPPASVSVDSALSPSITHAAI